MTSHMITEDFSHIEPKIFRDHGELAAFALAN
jgi:hypothetical protein